MLTPFYTGLVAENSQSSFYYLSVYEFSLKTLIFSGASQHLDGNTDLRR